MPVASSAPQPTDPAPVRPSTNPHPRRILVALLAITLLGLALRVRGLSESLWLDELHTGWVISAEGETLAARARSGNQSPCYFILEQACDRLIQRGCQWIGNAQFPYAQEWSLRFLSLLASSCLPWATYQLARQLGISPTLALLAPLLTTLDPQFIFYAQEARCYALVQLVAVLHLSFSLARWPQPRSERTAGRLRCTIQRVVWIMSAILLFYLHYLTLLLLVVNSAWLLLGQLLGQWRSCQEESAPSIAADWQTKSPAAAACTPTALVVDLLIVALGVIAGSDHLVAVAARRQNWLRFLPHTSWQSVWDWTSYLVAPLLVAGIFYSVRWVRQQVRRSRLKPGAAVPDRGENMMNASTSRPMLFLTFYVLSCTYLPLLVAVVAYELALGPPLLFRYIIASATLLPLTATLLAAWSPSLLGRGMVAVTAMGFLVSGCYPVQELLTGQPPAPQRGEDWRGLCRELDEQLRALPPTAARPIILLCPALVEDWQLSRATPALVDFCRFPLRSRYSLPLADSSIWPLPTIDAPRLTPEQATSLAAHLHAGHPVTLIVRGDEALADQVEADLRSSLAPHDIQIRSTRAPRFAGLIVATWQLR